MVTVERVAHSSALVLSDWVKEGEGEHLFTRTYYGYTIREAKALFRKQLEEASK